MRADPAIDLSERHALLAVDRELACGVHDLESPAGPKQAEAETPERALDPIGVSCWGCGHHSASCIGDVDRGHSLVWPA